MGGDDGGDEAPSGLNEPLRSVGGVVIMGDAGEPFFIGCPFDCGMTSGAMSRPDPWRPLLVLVVLLLLHS